jgi:hypothetical protein
VDTATLLMQATGPGMAEVLVMPGAGAVVFAEGSAPDGAEATEEALDGEPFIRLGAPVTIPRTALLTVILMG